MENQLRETFALLGRTRRFVQRMKKRSDREGGGNEE